jgi:hypothetical protein
MSSVDSVGLKVKQKDNLLYLKMLLNIIDDLCILRYILLVFWQGYDEK